jgi:hypothetical protein
MELHLTREDVEAIVLHWANEKMPQMPFKEAIISTYSSGFCTVKVKEKESE